jgi:hypothetical protein
MSSKVEKVVCRASECDFIFVNFAGRSFSTATSFIIRYFGSASQQKISGALSEMPVLRPSEVNTFVTLADLSLPTCNLIFTLVRRRFSAVIRS